MCEKNNLKIFLKGKNVLIICLCHDRNFNWVTRTSARSKKRRLVAEAIARGPLDQEIVNANRYVTQMLAASLGLKLCDVGRRILLYTKPYHDNKSFYAVCRGIFPIQELCGTMTVIGLAKRDLLGVDMPLWKLLLPAVVIHGMANFRGMKVRNRWRPSLRHFVVCSWVLPLLYCL